MFLPKFRGKLTRGIISKRFLLVLRLGLLTLSGAQLSWNNCRLLRCGLTMDLRIKNLQCHRFRALVLLSRFLDMEPKLLIWPHLLESFHMFLKCYKVQQLSVMSGKSGEGWR
ncbi:hypothetical protein C5167_024868 [Papaver somniferum]|uniref:Uncharacterized protein n=1 Tax=Papaver somniferum TaxID=3469 RepID=A0A4Y7JQX0_PAPSO|nr:hypothetical protein C5167_024868 [Papaver somniferum]